MSELSADMAGIVTVLPPIWDLDAFWSVLRDADINVAVVNRNPVTDAKSEIKWLEAALFGIPSVVSRTATYEEVVEDGRTGFLCDSSDDFYRQLDRLVRDRELRQQVGQTARAAVLSRYNLHTLAENLRGTLASLSPAVAVRPKIVIVNVFYPPQAYGGATRVVYDNVTDLKARYGDRFDIEVFTTLEGGTDPFEVSSYVEGGVRVTCVTTPDDPDINHRTTSSPMGKIFSDYLADAQPHLVHFHCIQRLTVSIVEATAKAGIPYVITAHDGWWISDRQFLVDADGEIELYDYANGRRVALELGGGALSRQSALKPALFGARKVLAVSEPFAGIYRQAQVPNVIAVPNGVSKLPSGRRSMSASGRVRLGHVGGTERHKGLYLVKTALLSESFANLELTVVDYAKPLGYSAVEIWGTTPVRIIARLPQSRVAELYENIDVHLACSIWPESYGLVTRESAAFGCWIVASDAGAVAEPVIEGQNGHVVRHGELDDLVRVFRQIDGDPEKYRGPTLRQPPIRRSYEQADDLAKIYGELIGASGEALPEAVGLPLRSDPTPGAADGNAVAAE
jgi:glycosyltransferase involved in cell wall biosynthesis